MPIFKRANILLSNLLQCIGYSITACHINNVIRDLIGLGLGRFFYKEEGSIHHGEKCEKLFHNTKATVHEIGGRREGTTECDSFIDTV